VKLKRSKILLISFLGALVTPGLVFANGVRTHYLRPDVVVKMADFYNYCITYSMLMFGLIVYVVIAAYLFSREYAENTLKTILTVPVRKLTFIISKFSMLFIWVMVLTLVSWASIYIITALYSIMFGLAEFGAAVAFEYLVKMTLAGVLMFLTISPFAFLSMRSKGIVVPVIAAATVAMGNVVIYSESLAALFPWAASYLLVRGEIAQTGYPLYLVIGLIAVVSIFGFAVSIIYFQREDIK
jgi:bacitracin transport system permease protein